MSSRSVASMACALALTASATVFAQQPASPVLVAVNDTGKTGSQAPLDTPEIYILSTRAGGINLIEGTVSVRRKADADWSTAVGQKRLKTGDRLRTGLDGRAEILLNPGSYLRLDRESEIELTEPTLDKLAVTLTRGTTLFEVTGAKDTRLYITVETPRGRVLITRAGVYRIGVRPDGAVEATIRKGELQLASTAGQKIGDGRVVILDGKTVNVAKIDKKAPEDAFEAWSRGRAEMLAQANERLRRQAAQVRGALNGYRNGGSYGFGYAPYFGLWFFDASIGCHAFYPFYGGWRSNYYGYGYSSCYGLPWRDFTPVVPPPSTSPTLPPGAVGGVRNPGVDQTKGNGNVGGAGLGGPVEARPKSPDGRFVGPAIPGETGLGGSVQARPKSPGATFTGPAIPGEGRLTPLPERRLPTPTEAAAARGGGYNNDSGSSGVFGNRNSDASSSGGGTFRDTSSGGSVRPESSSAPSAPTTGGYNRGSEPAPKGNPSPQNPNPH